MKVKKYLGDIIRQCECRRWLIHWEKSQRKKYKSIPCSVFNCADPADVGSHVVKCNNTDAKPYIVPLCLWHNAKNECLQLTQDAVLVDPNPLDSCEQKS